MAWGKNNGVNKRQIVQEKNYPGYRICYGIHSEKTANGNVVLNYSGIIPLAISLINHSSTDGYTVMYVGVNGVKKGLAAGYALELDSLYIDLESWFGLNIIKEFGSVETTRTNGTGKAEIKIVKWLEPNELSFDPQNNYPGYTIGSGSLSFSELISRNYVPLNYTTNASATTNGANRIYLSLSIVSSTGGTKTKHIAEYPFYNIDKKGDTFWNIDVDIEKLYDYNIDYLKGITSFTSTGTIALGGSFTKWLIPNGMLQSPGVNGCNIFISNSSTSVTRNVDFEISALGKVLKTGNIGVPHNQPAIIGVIGNFLNVEDIVVKFTGGEISYMSYHKEMI